MKSGNLNFLEPSGALQACNGTDFIFTFLLQWVLWVLTHGVKQAPHVGDHPPPSSAEVKNEWSYAPTSPCAFTASSGTASTLLLSFIIFL